MMELRFSAPTGHAMLRFLSLHELEPGYRIEPVS
jgi:hypothetical protein